MTEQACLETPEDMAGKHPGPTSTSAIPCQQHSVFIQTLEHIDFERFLLLLSSPSPSPSPSLSLPPSPSASHSAFPSPSPSQAGCAGWGCKVGGVGAVTRRRRLQ